MDNSVAKRIFFVIFFSFICLLLVSNDFIWTLPTVLRKLTILITFLFNYQNLKPSKKITSLHDAQLVLTTLQFCEIN